jgi:hypothetical protein
MKESANVFDRENVMKGELVTSVRGGGKKKRDAEDPSCLTIASSSFLNSRQVLLLIYSLNSQLCPSPLVGYSLAIITEHLLSSTVALLSVYDKTGLLDLAKGLHAAGVRLLGSGGTAKKIRDAGIPIE